MALQDHLHFPYPNNIHCLLIPTVQSDYVEFLEVLCNEKPNYICMFVSSELVQDHCPSSEADSDGGVIVAISLPLNKLCCDNRGVRKGPIKNALRKASPFGHVSMYRKNRDRHCGISSPVAKHCGRSLNTAAIMFYAFELSFVGSYNWSCLEE
ncbi:hypothetical protein Tco_0511364 [Tanacetum coccineum]